MSITGRFNMDSEWTYIQISRVFGHRHKSTEKYKATDEF